MRALTLPCSALLVLMASAPVHAQEASAEDLFRESAEAYRGGDFQRAANLLRQAYETDPVPILQYNLARALEGLGDDEGAIEAYRIYLDGSPDAEDRPSVEARLESLERQVAERQVLEAQAANARPDPPETDEADASTPPPGSASPSAVPWIIGGVGVAGIVVAAVLGGVAQSTHEGALGEPVQQIRVERANEAEGYATAANVTFGVAGAVVLAGLIWGIVDLVTLGDDDSSVQASFGLGGARVSGSF